MRSEDAKMRMQGAGRNERRPGPFLTLAAAAAILGAVLTAGYSVAQASADKYAAPANSALPPPTCSSTWLARRSVVIDPQVDFLSPKGVAWGAVGDSVQQHNTVENLGRLFAAAKAGSITVAVSPHHYYPTDKGWKFEGALEKLMHKIGMFNRLSRYSMEGFENSGADFMPEYKPYILDSKTIIASPHKVYGPEQNDLALQLRKNRIDQVVLAGMSANLCVESHLRELLERGLRGRRREGRHRRRHPPRRRRLPGGARRTSASSPTRSGPRTRRSRDSRPRTEHE